MKKTLSFIIAFFMCLSVGITAYAQPVAINISQNSAEDVFSINPYGIDLTGDDCAIGGGLGAELVQNGSFENKDMGWSFEGTNCILGNTDSIDSNNPAYNIVKVQGSCILKNHGYGEEKAMGFIEGERYCFSCYIKNIDYDGEILIQLSSKKNGSNLVKLSTDALSKKSWLPVKAEITARADENGELAIIFNGNGSLQLDCVSLIPKNSYGNNTGEWKNAVIRNDTMQALKMLNPDFVMFCADGDEWQATTGEQSRRSGNSYIGYHEYLQLCSDLNAKPIPTIDTDLVNNIDNIDNYVQGVIDFIDYANADSITGYFGALRAGNGSEEPFNLEYIYLKGKGSVLGEIKSAVSERYENIAVLTDDYVKSINCITDYGKTTTKSNMGNALLSAGEMLSSDCGFVAYKNAIGLSEYAKDEPYMIMIDKGRITLSPEYYAQLLLANNFGERQIKLAQANEKIIQAARLDSAKHILYVYFVNSGGMSKSINLTLDNFENIVGISAQELSSGYKTTANADGKQRIAPKEADCEFDGNDVEITLNSNSITIVRVAYEGNTGQNIYHLPDELDISTKLYIPPAVKVIVIALCGSIPVGGVLGFFLYKKVISKRKRVQSRE